MKYLLDVSALLAWCHTRSPHNRAFHTWAKKADFANMVTCATVELGFLRISMQGFGYSLANAQQALEQMKNKMGGFISDCPSPKLAAWASTAGKTTDAYFCQLAAAHKLQLATFDSGIKDAAAFLIV